MARVTVSFEKQSVIQSFLIGSRKYMANNIIYLLQNAENFNKMFCAVNNWFHLFFVSAV